MMNCYVLAVKFACRTAWMANNCHRRVLLGVGRRVNIEVSDQVPDTVRQPDERKIEICGGQGIVEEIQLWRRSAGLTATFKPSRRQLSDSRTMFSVASAAIVEFDLHRIGGAGSFNRSVASRKIDHVPNDVSSREKQVRSDQEARSNIFFGTGRIPNHSDHGPYLADNVSNRNVNESCCRLKHGLMFAFQCFAHQVLRHQGAEV